MVGFAGGERLKAYLEGMQNKLETASSVNVGFLEGATEADGTSIPMIAAIQEFGAPKKSIPPRPFFRNMIKAKKGSWGDAAAKVLRASDYNTATALNRIGEAIAGQLRESIIATTEPALSPVTLMLREMRHNDPSLAVSGTVVGEAAARVAAGESYSGASTKPLVDSGTLLRSVDYEVKE